MSYTIFPASRIAQLQLHLFWTQHANISLKYYLFDLFLSNTGMKIKNLTGGLEMASYYPVFGNASET